MRHFFLTNASRAPLLVNSIWPLASSFSFVLQPKLGITRKLEEWLDSKRESLLDLVTTNAWPGTTLIDGTAQVRFFQCTEALKSALECLGADYAAWAQPNEPEDLALYRSDGSLLLQSTTHERDWRVFLTDEEFDALHERIGEFLVLDEA